VSEVAKPTTRRQAIKISRWARAAAGLLGLAGVGAGGTAVFVTDVEAGPVALIAAGVLFLLIGLSGVLPTRLKVGDNEAEWNQEVLTDVVEALVESADASAFDTVGVALEYLATVSPGVAQRAKLTLARERILDSRLRPAVQKLGLSIGHTVNIGGRNPDAVVIARDGRKVLVEIYDLTPTPEMIQRTRQFYEQARRLDTQFAGALAVSIGAPKAFAFSDFTELNLRYVKLTQGEETEQLEQALIAILDL
jgi:hypothetical protein